MSEKVTGYILLGLGVVIMIFTVLQIFLVFTGQTPAPRFMTFTQQQVNEQVNQSVESTDTLSNLLNGNTKNLNLTPNIEVIPAETLNKILNLTLYYFLMSFIMGFGYKLASLGAVLLRPVYIKSSVIPEKVAS